MTDVSLSIVIPSYNEEKNIEATILEVSKALAGATADYEFIIVNDASKDRTGEIADRLAKENPRVRVHHNPVNLGFGGSYRKGVAIASKEYVILVPGDNELKPDSVRTIFQFAGKADIIASYPENIQIRPWGRILISTLYTWILNQISGYGLKYYNGPSLIRKRLLDQIKFDSNGFAFQAEILVALLSRGCSCQEVPFQLNYSSKRLMAFRPKNVASVSYTILRMAFAYRLRPVFKRV